MRKKEAIKTIKQEAKNFVKSIELSEDQRLTHYQVAVREYIPQLGRALRTGETTWNPINHARRFYRRWKREQQAIKRGVPKLKISKRQRRLADASRSEEAQQVSQG